MQTPNPYTTGTIFRHYKGKDYEFISFAKDSETLEELIVYKALYGNFDIWVRPKAMFIGTVNLEGETVPRFAPTYQKQYVIISPELLNFLDENNITFQDVRSQIPEECEVRYTATPGDNKTTEKELTIAIITVSAVSLLMIIKSITSLIKTIQHKPIILEYEELQEIWEDGKILKDESGIPIWKIKRKHSVVEFTDSKENTEIALNADVKGITLNYKSNND